MTSTCLEHKNQDYIGRIQDGKEVILSYMSVKFIESPFNIKNRWHKTQKCLIGRNFLNINMNIRHQIIFLSQCSNVLISFTGTHLANQDYDVCIRRLADRCTICWSPIIMGQTAATTARGTFGLRLVKARRCFRMEGALHTDLWKSETSRDIKKSFWHHLNIFNSCVNFWH